MKPLKNPFITSGYESAEYFCDREQESENLIREVTNGNNLALISTRRMGKTGLIQHCFHNPEIKDNYYTFFVDIYATKSLRDLVFSLSRVIVDGLKPFGKKAIESFWNSVKSLQGGITFAPAGNPSFNLQLGDIRSTEATLDEIFRYLEKASRLVIVAIDEFQQVAYYTEKNGSIGITDRYADTPAGSAFRERKIDGFKPSIFRSRRISRFNFRLLRYVSADTNYPENGRR